MIKKDPREIAINHVKRLYGHHSWFRGVSIYGDHQIAVYYVNGKTFPDFFYLPHEHAGVRIDWLLMKGGD